MTDSLSASEEVCLSRRCVEKSGIKLVTGETVTKVFQAFGGILVHGGLTENPVPVTWRRKKKKTKPKTKQKDEKRGN